MAEKPHAPITKNSTTRCAIYLPLVRQHGRHGCHGADGQRGDEERQRDDCRGVRPGGTPEREAAEGKHAQKLAAMKKIALWPWEYNSSVFKADSDC